jgi:putative phosphoesterase
MLIGIMSDAHDSIQGVKDALSMFSQKGVSMVLFAGDMIGSGNCYTFEGFGIPIKLVYGNNDGDRVGLFREFARLGGEYLGDFGEVEADGLRIALMHGTEEPLVKAVVASQIYDVVVRGHFTGLSSIAILDTADLKVEKIELGKFKTFREIIKG